MKILNKLTLEHLKLNKKRTVVTVIGIILSTALMVGIGLLFSTVRDNAIKSTIDYSGNHHVKLEVPYDKLDAIRNESYVKEVKFTSSNGYADNPLKEDTYFYYLRVVSGDKNYLETINLTKGRLPKNNKEIVIESYLNEYFDIGDEITLDLGYRVDLDGNKLGDSPLLSEHVCDDLKEECELVINEKLITNEKNTYKIVGVYEDQNWSQIPGMALYTTDDYNDNVNAYIVYNKPEKAYDNTEKLISNLNLDIKKDDIIYNDALLGFYGVSKYNNITDSIASVMCIVLGLISVACIIVIYNSFAISVMERKRQFGLFSSIGATRKQLRYTVFFEAFIVGLIGIILGIIGAYIGIGLLLMFINHLLPEVFDNNLALSTYPIFIIIPIIFMILTILISAFIPSLMASRVSPITAIRQNDDIKIKAKKLKTPFFVKWFGVEGEIAYKNMKRNKKKYRVTIASLFISIVLFVVFSALMEYSFGGMDKYAEITDYNYSVSFSHKKDKQLEADAVINKILKTNNVEKYTLYREEWLNAYVDGKKLFSSEFKKFAHDNNIEPYEEPNVRIFIINDEAYDNFKKEIGLKEDKVLAINYFSSFIYKNNSRKFVESIPYNNLDSIDFIYYEDNRVLPLKDIYFTNKVPFGIDGLDSRNIFNIVVNEELYNKLFYEETDYEWVYYNLSMKVKDDEAMDKLFDEDDKNNVLVDGINISNFNIEKSYQMQRNLILVVKVLFYGFIGLVTLIGITSVINTINTSMSLRRREFAVLRSIGLSPKGFNRMLIFECLFFGLKALFYALPVSLIIILLIHKSINNLVTFDSLIIPYSSILICVLGVFMITGLCMWYATSRIKRENILETIRNENI